MKNILVARPLDGVLVNAIGFYQRFISPRKGWRCAHARLHGGASCSGFVKAAIAESGWQVAAPAVKQRFVECKRAADVLRQNVRESEDEVPEEETDSDAKPPSKPGPRRRDHLGSWYDSFDCCLCVDLGCSWPLKPGHGPDFCDGDCGCCGVDATP